MSQGTTEKYDHTKKAGNEGDVVKHAVLARLVDRLSARPRTEPFFYAESHCGRAMYPLRSGGEWERGIKVFAQSAILEGARQSWTDKHSSTPALPALRPYAELFPEPATAGIAYPGSSMVVFRILTGKAGPFRFQLWDMDEEVCIDLFRAYPQWAQVSICRGNGLDGVKRLRHADLALIDPFSLENELDGVLSTLQTLSHPHVQSRTTPFLCWTPLVKTPQGLEASQRFFAETKGRGYFVDRVWWALPQSVSCWGCQITASEDLGDWVAATIEDLLHIMTGWHRL